MKRLAQLAVCGLMLAASTGCCWRQWGAGYGGCGGCGNGCGYGAGYGGGFQGAYAPVGGTAMAPGYPAYAGAPMIAPTTAYAPLNPIPTY